MNLSRLGNRIVVTASPTDTIADILRLMDQRNVGSVVAVEDARPVGIVTDRDVALRVTLRGRDPRTTTVESVMSRDVACVREETEPLDAAELMRRRQVRRLPIVDARGRLVGLVSLDDLVYRFSREVGELADVLAPFPETQSAG